ncbi:FIVAR domain-containing protein [Mycoplasma sp. Mirounga ES2805-ORL]|uniref:FIVAR domain-containing protein n=1 Tax=Mycoplasma sp. Mirounga ES2805-ORL TaxID=754514 RepID=UPI00197BB848|nr:FIVAR domain-containing protein [Mycoplasma sp. Mirounga ES2805-ORL]QSF13588.1 FIVAR domain-containing protein [Mycoplasma sp. Mirounga ES2805-ORL]
MSSKNKKVTATGLVLLTAAATAGTVYILLDKNNEKGFYKNLIKAENKLKNVQNKEIKNEDILIIEELVKKAKEDYKKIENNSNIKDTDKKEFQIRLNQVQKELSIKKHIIATKALTKFIAEINILGNEAKYASIKAKLDTEIEKAKKTITENSLPTNQSELNNLKQEDIDQKTANLAKVLIEISKAKNKAISSKNLIDNAIEQLSIEIEKAEKFSNNILSSSSHYIDLKNQLDQEIKKTKDLLNKVSPEATLNELSEAKNNLNRKYNEIVEKQKLVEKKIPLQQLYNDKQTELDKYPNVSISNAHGYPTINKELEQAYSEAKKILDNEKATPQMVDDANVELQEAINKAKDDKNKIEKAWADLDTSILKKDSELAKLISPADDTIINNLKQAFNDAENISKTSSKFEILEAKRKLDDAILNAIIAKADSHQAAEIKLENLIKKINDEKGFFTNDSKLKLDNDLLVAQNVLGKNNPKATEAELADAYNVLNESRTKAIKDLKKVYLASKDKLEKVFILRDEKLSLYEDTIKEELKIEFEKAKSLLDKDEPQENDFETYQEQMISFDKETIKLTSAIKNAAKKKLVENIALKNTLDSELQEILKNVFEEAESKNIDSSTTEELEEANKILEKEIEKAKLQQIINTKVNELKDCATEAIKDVLKHSFEIAEDIINEPTSTAKDLIKFKNDLLDAIKTAAKSSLTNSTDKESDELDKYNSPEDHEIKTSLQDAFSKAKKIETNSKSTTQELKDAKKELEEAILIAKIAKANNNYTQKLKDVKSKIDELKNADNKKSYDVIIANLEKAIAESKKVDQSGLKTVEGFNKAIKTLGDAMSDATSLRTTIDNELTNAKQLLNNSLSKKSKELAKLADGEDNDIINELTNAFKVAQDVYDRSPSATKIEINNAKEVLDKAIQKAITDKQNKNDDVAFNKIKKECNKVKESASESTILEDKSSIESAKLELDKIIDSSKKEEANNLISAAENRLQAKESAETDARDKAILEAEKVTDDTTPAQDKIAITAAKKELSKITDLAKKAKAQEAIDKAEQKLQAKEALDDEATNKAIEFAEKVTDSSESLDDKQNIDNAKKELIKIVDPTKKAKAQEKIDKASQIIAKKALDKTINNNEINEIAKLDDDKYSLIKTNLENAFIKAKTILNDSSSSAKVLEEAKIQLNKDILKANKERVVIDSNEVKEYLKSHETNTGRFANTSNNLISTLNSNSLDTTNDVQLQTNVNNVDEAVINAKKDIIAEFLKRDSAIHYLAVDASIFIDMFGEHALINESTPFSFTNHAKDGSYIEFGTNSDVIKNSNVKLYSEPYDYANNKESLIQEMKKALQDIVNVKLLNDKYVSGTINATNDNWDKLFENVTNIFDTSVEVINKEEKLRDRSDAIILQDRKGLVNYSEKDKKSLSRIINRFMYNDFIAFQLTNEEANIRTFSEYTKDSDIAEFANKLFQSQYWSRIKISNNNPGEYDGILNRISRILNSFNTTSLETTQRSEIDNIKHDTTFEGFNTIYENIKHEAPHMGYNGDKTNQYIANKLVHRIYTLLNKQLKWIRKLHGITHNNDWTSFYNAGTNTFENQTSTSEQPSLSANEWFK